MDFYAGPVLPEGTRRGPQYQAEEQTSPDSCPRTDGGYTLFTPQGKCPRARCPGTPSQLPRLCLSDTQPHRQCAACAAMGREGKALLCKRPPWAPPPPRHLRRAARQGTSGESTHSPGGGGHAIWSTQAYASWHMPHAGLCHAHCADWCHDFPIISALTPLLNPSKRIPLGLCPRGEGPSPFPIL